jgi:hypothetical protein
MPEKRRGHSHSFIITLLSGANWDPVRIALMLSRVALSKIICPPARSSLLKVHTPLHMAILGTKFLTHETGDILKPYPNHSRKWVS